MNHLVDTYGYWAVALLVLSEALGVPLPGETAVIAAAVYAGSTHRLSPWGIFAVAALSAVAGGGIGYGIGRLGGYRLLRRYGAKVHFDARKLRISRYLFDTYGPLVVFFGRFVSILRTYAAFLAGTSRMRWERFAVANATGGVVWAAFYTFVAYEAGGTLRRLSGTLTWILAGVAVMVLVAAVVFARRRMEDLAAKAEAAYPGPLE
ncbi:MAG: DedA family protein [Acidimicrobiales bacterium]